MKKAAASISSQDQLPRPLTRRSDQLASTVTSSSPAQPRLSSRPSRSTAMPSQKPSSRASSLVRASSSPEAQIISRKLGCSPFWSSWSYCSPLTIRTSPRTETRCSSTSLSTKASATAGLRPCCSAQPRNSARSADSIFSSTSSSSCSGRPAGPTEIGIAAPMVAVGTIQISSQDIAR